MFLQTWFYFHPKKHIFALEFLGVINTLTSPSTAIDGGALIATKSPANTVHEVLERRIPTCDMFSSFEAAKSGRHGII